jgi:carboxymethylenebutenolidase
MIDFPAGHGHGSGYLVVPEGGDVPGVLVIHAWWGLNRFFRRFCDRLAENGFVVLAPDLYHGTVVSTVSGADRLSSELKRTLVERELNGAVNYLRTTFATNEGKIGVVGFSMGANFGLWLATTRPNDVAAVVAFYGTRDENYKRARAAFLGHFAEKDEWEPLDSVKRLEELIRSAGREVTFRIYPKTKHWFFEENRPSAYDAKAARLAWRRTLRFLHSHLDWFEDH